MRKPATRLSFPKLLDRVNAGLTSPLEFVQEFLSIQTVRNSLEHRNVDAQNGQPLVDILGRLTTRSKSYALGERITFTPEEFSEIAMACGRFGFELAHKLPTLSAPK